MPRSSISKTPLRLANSIGLIDGGYRGEIMAMCDNIKTDSYTVEKGQRLFQIVCDCSPITYDLIDQLSKPLVGRVDLEVLENSMSKNIYFESLGGASGDML